MAKGSSAPLLEEGEKIRAGVPTDMTVEMEKVSVFFAGAPSARLTGGATPPARCCGKSRRQRHVRPGRCAPFFAPPPVLLSPQAWK